MNEQTEKLIHRIDCRISRLQGNIEILLESKPRNLTKITHAHGGLKELVDLKNEIIKNSQALVCDNCGDEIDPESKWGNCESCGDNLCSDCGSPWSAHGECTDCQRKAEAV